MVWDLDWYGRRCHSSHSFGIQRASLPLMAGSQRKRGLELPLYLDWWQMKVVLSGTRYGGWLSHSKRSSPQFWTCKSLFGRLDGSSRSQDNIIEFLWSVSQKLAWAKRPEPFDADTLSTVLVPTGFTTTTNQVHSNCHTTIDIRLGASSKVYEGILEQSIDRVDMMVCAVNISHKKPPYSTILVSRLESWFTSLSPSLCQEC